jgi:hypothetical protein
MNRLRALTQGAGVLIVGIMCAAALGLLYRVFAFAAGV